MNRIRLMGVGRKVGKINVSCGLYGLLNLWKDKNAPLFLSDQISKLLIPFNSVCSYILYILLC